MCSIMGYCGSNADFNIFKKGFDRTITRGPDESRIIDTGNGFLGFHRLAIMGLSPSGMQPFELYATEKYMGLNNSKNSFPKNILFKASPTVRYYFPCTASTKRICLQC